MKPLVRALVFACAMVLALAVFGPTTSTAEAATLVYADEFNGPLNTSVWQQLTPWRTRYTTGELQYYAPENVTFTNGNMRILTERRSVNGYNYASGIVTSLNKPFSYGYFESRFNMPTGKGLWPAFWLTNDRTHEIDMMEFLGEDPTRMYFTYHKGGNQLFQRYFDNNTDLAAGWHTVGMDWQPTYIRWYLDGSLVAEYRGTIISDPMYLIFNTSVGGAWAVDPDASTPFPQEFLIDYVRVYDQKPSSTQPTPGPTPSPTPDPVPEPEPVDGVTRHQQDDIRLCSTGQWATWSNGALSGGSYRYANGVGAALTATFEGTRLDLIARTGPEFGIAKVIVDGKPVATADLYSPSTRYQQNIFTTEDLPKGEHSVRLEWTGTRNPASSGTYVNADAFLIKGVLKQGPVRIEERDARLAYSGPWWTWANPVLSGGSYRYAGAPGSAVTTTFDGTRLDLVARMGPEFGIARVLVDGKPAALVDLFAPTTRYQQRVFTTDGLTAGRHTVSLEWTGTKNPAAHGTYVNIDGIDVAGTLPAGLVRYEQTDPRLTYVRGWSTWSNAVLSGGSYGFVDKVDAEVYATFEGTRVNVIARTGPEFGIAKVVIDNESETYVDLYSPVTMYQQKVFSSEVLSGGTHTIEFEWTGTKHPSSAGTYVSFDALDVAGVLR